MIIKTVRLLESGNRLSRQFAKAAGADIALVEAQITQLLLQADHGFAGLHAFIKRALRVEALGTRLAAERADGIAGALLLAGRLLRHRPRTKDMLKTIDLYIALRLAALAGLLARTGRLAGRRLGNDRLAPVMAKPVDIFLLHSTAACAGIFAASVLRAGRRLGDNHLAVGMRQLVDALTDSIVATIKYFEKLPPEKRRSNEKIIEDIFRLRLEQGTLDQAGLSLKEYQTLKEFYAVSLPKGGKK